MRQAAIRSRIIALLAPLALAATASAQNGPTSQVDFRNDMRKLWEDHVTWTRLYIVDAAAGLPEQEATTQRLLRNQTEIGDAIKSFYGNPAGDRLTALLKDHITTAAELIDAAKAGDDAKKDAANKRWLTNADEIATFLSNANPKQWPVGEMKGMLHDHLTLTTAEVVAQLHQDWAGSIAAYDKVHLQVLKMADALSLGIIRQHPSRFRAGTVATKKQ
jgi:hypothetical protein